MYLVYLVIALLACAHAKSVERETKIVGGEKAPRSYPYQISLQVKTPEYLPFWLPIPTGKYKYSHNCGGSIIEKNYVLTAAHCVVDYEAQDLSIWAGTNKLDGKGERYFVEEITVHENYKELVTSDIALLKINGAFNYSSTIASIKYSNQKIGGGVITTLTGWGYTNQYREGKPANDLQRIYLQSITNDQCRAKGQNVTNTETCTSAPPKKGACGGDSGGPLAIGDGKEVVGIVSYGTSVCALGYPDVFTRVSEFYGWIKNNTDA